VERGVCLFIAFISKALLFSSKCIILLLVGSGRFNENFGWLKFREEDAFRMFYFGPFFCGDYSLDTDPVGSWVLKLGNLLRQFELYSCRFVLIDVLFISYRCCCLS